MHERYHMEQVRMETIGNRFFVDSFMELAAGENSVNFSSLI